MSSSPKKIIVVVGATGNQGSSVAHTFLSLPNWHVRCVTRNPSSTASQALASLGAEVVQADLSSPPSLVQAFQNANAIFLNTDFWAAYAASAASGELPSSEAAFDQEISCGKNAAIAAADVPSLERLIYSALPGAKKHSKGKYARALHLETKAAVVEYIEKEQPELAKKTSFIYLGGYATNKMFTPHFDAGSGKHRFVLPLKRETRMPIVNEKESTGPFVRALVEDEDAGTKLLAYDSYLSVGELVDVWSRATGKEAVLVEVPADFMHQQLKIPFEVLDSASFIGEFGYTGGIDGIIEPSQLKTKVETKPFEDWLKEQE